MILFICLLVVIFIINANRDAENPFLDSLVAAAMWWAIIVAVGSLI